MLNINIGIKCGRCSHHWWEEPQVLSLHSQKIVAGKALFGLWRVAQEEFYGAIVPAKAMWLFS